MKKNIKIFVSHHKSGYIYKDDVFIPIQVGKKFSKIDLGILGDDTGDNISDKNSNYAELTAQYWVWKNYDLSNVDYVGFCHYRRYLDFGISIKLDDIRYILNNSKGLYSKCCNLFDYIFQFRGGSPKFGNEIIKSYAYNIKKYVNNNDSDIFLYKTSISIRNNYELVYLGLKNKELYETLYNVIIDLYPYYKDSIEQVGKIRKGNYGNIFIMNKKTFFEYSERLFSILFKFEKELIAKNLNKISFEEPITADTRFLGCLSERLLNLFVIQKRNEGITINRCAKYILMNIPKK